MLELIRRLGQPICAALYALFGVMAARKKPWPLLALVATHAAEYVLVGRKVAAEKKIPAAAGLLQCLAFGFTWWLPLKK